MTSFNDLHPDVMDLVLGNVDNRNILAVSQRLNRSYNSNTAIRTRLDRTISNIRRFVPDFDVNESFDRERTSSIKDVFVNKYNQVFEHYLEQGSIYEFLLLLSLCPKSDIHEVVIAAINIAIKNDDRALILSLLTKTKIKVEELNLPDIDIGEIFISGEINIPSLCNIITRDCNNNRSRFLKRFEKLKRFTLSLEGAFYEDRAFILLYISNIVEYVEIPAELFGINYPSMTLERMLYGFNKDKCYPFAESIMKEAIMLNEAGKLYKNDNGNISIDKKVYGYYPEKLFTISLLQRFVESNNESMGDAAFDIIKNCCYANSFFSRSVRKEHHSFEDIVLFLSCCSNYDNGCRLLNKIAFVANISQNDIESIRRAAEINENKDYIYSVLDTFIFLRKYQRLQNIHGDNITKKIPDIDNIIQRSPIKTNKNLQRLHKTVDDIVRRHSRYVTRS